MSSPWNRVVLVLVAGLGTGILTQVLQSVLPTGWSQAGLLVPLVLGRSRQDRVGAYVAAVPALALGAVGFAVFIWIYDVIPRISG